jgi:hypothetical protein
VAANTGSSPFPTQDERGPSTVPAASSCFEPLMILSGVSGWCPLKGRRSRIRWIESAIFNHDLPKRVYKGIIHVRTATAPFRGSYGWADCHRSVTCATVVSRRASWLDRLSRLPFLPVGPVFGAPRQNQGRLPEPSLVPPAARYAGPYSYCYPFDPDLAAPWM